jgi:hypothetical protein
MPIAISSSSWRKLFLAKLARVASINLTTLTAGAVFSDDLNLVYGGVHFLATVMPGGRAVGQLYMVATLPGGQPYNFPLNASSDLTAFQSFVGGGAMPSILSIYTQQQKYIIIAAEDTDTLAALVNTALTNGYTVSGFAFAFNSQICQPMILK